MFEEDQEEVNMVKVLLIAKRRPTTNVHKNSPKRLVVGWFILFEGGFYGSMEQVSQLHRSTDVDCLEGCREIRLREANEYS